MTSIYSLWDVALAFAVGLLIARYFGLYMARVFMGRPSLLDGVFLPVERAIYRLLGIHPRTMMGWREYAVTLIILNAIAIAFVFFLLLVQGQPGVPLNALGVPDMSWDLATHTAVSFDTNTDFQHYTGETQVSLLSALFGLQLMMFLSAVTGLSVIVAFVRGFSRRDGTLGNAWVDLVKSTTRVFLPVCLVAAVIFLAFGVPQTLSQTITVSTLSGGQAGVPSGPIASWNAIELLGTNGGGYFGANFGAALQNPSAITNDISIVLMMLVAFATPFMFGEMVRRPKETYPLMATVLAIFLIALALFFVFEISNPFLNGLQVSQASGYTIGAETRFTLGEDAMFQVVSIYSNVGATSMSLTSLTPGAQLVLLWGMFLQCAPGGVGTGFGMLLINTLLAIFVGGLMVGRTPEYLGKKIGRSEMKWAAVTLLSHPFAILIPLALAAVTGVIAVSNGGAGGSGPGAQGFTQVLYEFTSESANNGSGMGYPYGLGDTLGTNGLFFNLVGAVIMLVGRYLPIVAMLAIGGALARADAVPPSSGTLKTTSATFTAYLIVFILVVTGLLFLPVLALGPFSSGVTLP